MIVTQPTPVTFADVPVGNAFSFGGADYQKRASGSIPPQTENATNLATGVGSVVAAGEVVTHYPNAVVTLQP